MKNKKATPFQNFLYWAEQFLILIAHLFLLGWILFALNKGGTLKTSQILLHFLGIGLYGASLIRICAYLAQRRFKKEVEEMQRHQNNHSHSHSQPNTNPLTQQNVQIQNYNHDYILNQQLNQDQDQHPHQYQQSPQIFTQKFPKKEDVTNSPSRDAN